jgi:hypothetical protein
VATVFWAIVGGFLALLLLAAALMDRGAKRRQARISSSGDIWREVRESRRDAEVIDSTGFGPPRGDIGWTSWSRRNHDNRQGPHTD